MTNASSGSSYGRKVAILLLVNTAFYLQNILLLPLLTRFLGVEAYGLWTQVAATVGLLTPLALLGMPSTFMRFSAASTDSSQIAGNYVSSLLMIVGASLLAAAALYESAELVARWLIKDSPEAADAVRAASLLVVFEPLSRFSTAYFRTFQRTGVYSMFRLLQPAMTLGAVVLLLAAGYGVTEVLLGLSVAHAALFALGQGMILREVGVGRPQLALMRPFLAFGLPLLPGALVNWVVGLADRYVIGAHLGVGAVGTYAAGYSLGMVVMFFYAPFRVFMYAKATELWEAGDTAGMARILSYSNKIPLLLSLGTLAGLLTLQDSLVILLTGSRLAISPYLITSVCLGHIFLYVGTCYGVVFHLMGETKLYSYGYTIAAITNLVGNLLIVPWLGITGAALVTMGSYFVGLVYFVVRSRPLHRVEIEWAYLWRAVLAAGMMATAIHLAARFLDPGSTANLCLLIAMGGALYFALIMALGAVTVDEVRYARQNVLRPTTTSHSDAP